MDLLKQDQSKVLRVGGYKIKKDIRVADFICIVKLESVPYQTGTAKVISNGMDEADFGMQSFLGSPPDS
jgi:hypothetical protein